MAGKETHFVMRQLFHDPTPNAVINQRFVTHLGFELAGPCHLSDQERKDFHRTLLMLANKLAAVWYHQDRYRTVEDKRILEERARPIEHAAQTMTIAYSNELFYEFDAFVVQVKSALDHLARIPRPFIGRGWTLATFGDKGRDVIKAAQNNVPDRLKGFALSYVHCVNEHASWLDDTIRARDRINHMQEGGIDPAETFVVAAHKDASGAVSVRVPMWSSDQTMRDFMTVAWSNLFMLCEDFTAFTVAMRVPEKWSLFRGDTHSVESLESPWYPVPKHVMEEVTAQDGWTLHEPTRRPNRKSGAGSAEDDKGPGGAK
jgi:hypothetical protein